MAKISIDVPDDVIRLGKDIIRDPKTKERFDKTPVDVLKEYNIKVPEGVTNEAVRALKAQDLIKGIQSAGRYVPTATVVVETVISPPVMAVAVVTAGALYMASEALPKSED